MTKIFLYMVAIIFFASLLWVFFVYYDENISESGKLSKILNQKIELLQQHKETEFKLQDITSFKWDKVCFYNQEGEYIDLEDNYLTEFLGYKPQFFFKSKYFINYDKAGLLFSDTKNKKIYIISHLRAWYHLSNIKPYYNGCYEANNNLTFFINI